MEAIEEAARSAKYSEAIIVNLTSSSDENERESKRELVLVATLDQQQGGIVWNDAALSPQDNNDEDVGIVRHLRTKRWVLPMLNDERRNQLYNEAVRAACFEAVKRYKQRTSTASSGTLRALDIGAGTGLLAMMTVKHTQEALSTLLEDDSSVPKVEVTSLEMASAMARLAGLTIDSNGLCDVIRIVEEHSCEADLGEKKFHICTSELLESGLLGEGILPSLRDAWQRHLDPDAVIVPRRARVFAQLLESQELVGNYRGPNESCSVRFSTSSDMSDPLLGGDSMDVEGKGIIVPLHASSLFSIDPPARLLSAPTMLMDINFSKDAIPGPGGQSRASSIVPTATGVAHGVLFWWELDLWDGLTYSTRQGTGLFQDHWLQCLYVFPVSPERCPRLSVGKVISLRCSHTDDQIKFAVDPRTAELERPQKRQRPVDDSSKPMARLISPERALQLNNEGRLWLIHRAIEHALTVKGKDSSVLDVSDFSLCAMLAALEGATCVSSLESSAGKLAMTSARVSAANGLPRAWNEQVAHYQIIQCHVSNLTTEILQNKPADIVAAEPYYEVLEGWHLQEALNYFYSVRALRERGLVKREALSVPSYASVVVCGIECKNLAQAYQECGDHSDNALICGFRHSDVNTYGDRHHRKAFSIRACEYEYTQLTEAVHVARIYYDGSCSIVGDNIWTNVSFQRPGTCHGVLCWVDYGMQSGNEQAEVLSTNSRCYRQLVQLLSMPVPISKEEISRFVSLLCRVNFSCSEGIEDCQLDIRVERRL